MNFYRRVHDKFWQGPRKVGQVVQPSYLPYRSGIVVAAYWLYYFILRFLTPTGRILFVLTSFIFAYVVFAPEKSPLVYLSFTLIALYLVSFLMGFFFRPKVYLHRSIPVFAEVDETIVASYKLKNLGFIKTWDLFIDTIECRLLSYPDGHPYFKECIPGQEYNFNSHIVFKRRGIFQIPSAMAESSFPFSLIRFSCWGSGNDEIIVLPRKANIKTLSFLHYEMSKSYSCDTNHMSGLGDEEFRACREYRTGDSIRYIDWAGWARTNKAIVKEYDDRATVHISLFLDSHFSSWKNLNRIVGYRNFEKAVSLLAGISAYLSKQGVLINKLVVGDKCVEIESERQPNLANEELQRFLAEYKQEEAVFSNEEMETACDFLGEESLVLMILLDESDLKMDLVKSLEKQGSTVKVISFAPDDSEQGFLRMKFKDFDVEKEIYL